MRSRNFIAKLIADGCKSLNQKYENRNYDFHTNGEEVLLRKLSKYDFNILFDVGGNIGDYSKLLRDNFPGAEIHIFEIVKENISLIKNNLQGDVNTVINEFGLSDKTTSVAIKYYGKGSGVNSMHDYPHKGETKWIEGDAVKGDEYITNNNIDHIDLLKIDVEGSEHLVLAGLSDTLKQKKIRVIQFEYGYINIITKYLLHDFYKLFKEAGYIVGKVYPQRVEFKEYTLKDENFFGPNYVAVKSTDEDMIRILSEKA